MTLYDLENALVWECDECKRQVVFPPSDFYRRKDELRERGWRFHLTEETGHEGWGRSWTHTCGYCDYKRRQTQIPLMERRFETVKGDKK